MITNRSPVADYRRWPFNNDAKWRWYDVVAFMPAMLLVVFVGLPLLSILQAREAERAP